MKKLLITVALAGIMMLALATAAHATQVVKAEASNSFGPATAHVSRGEKVVWKNVAPRRHTVTSTSSNWNKDKRLAPNGGTTSFTFHNSGTYKYHCTIHAGMTGKIVVG